jgi:hypothetical protein
MRKHNVYSVHDGLIWNKKGRGASIWKHKTSNNKNNMNAYTFYLHYNLEHNSVTHIHTFIQTKCTDDNDRQGVLDFLFEYTQTVYTYISWIGGEMAL